MPSSLGALARHHQRIGVLEPEFAEQRDVLLRQHGLQFASISCARLDVGALELVGPERAGIIDVDVDVAGGQRIENHVGAEPFARGAPAGPPRAAAAPSVPTARIVR